MAAQRINRQVLALGIVGAAVLLGAVLGRAQSVFPVRFDDAAVADGPLEKGGFFVWTGEITDGTKQTILSPGTLETAASDLHGVQFRVGIDPSTGPCTLTTGQPRYGATTTLTFDDLSFTVEGDGSFTVQRSGGVKTYSVILRGLYI